MDQKENKGGTQIRSLPRGPSRKDSSDKKMPRWIIYVGTASAALLIATFLLPAPKVRTTEQRSVAPAVANGDRVSAYQQDAEIQHRMMMRRRELENLQFKTATPANNESYLTLPDADVANMGVSMDADHSAERVYEDLADDSADADAADATPEERINRRLVHRKWLNETERAERIQVVSNFIKDAHDRGMDVEIDQNLVVVGVKRVNPQHKLNINQVIDRLAKDAP